MTQKKKTEKENLKKIKKFDAFITIFSILTFQGASDSKPGIEERQTGDVEEIPEKMLPERPGERGKREIDFYG